MNQFSAHVTKNREIALDYYELSFIWSADNTPEPGQFITLRCGTGTAPLLRRPFALSSYNPETKTARIIYQKRGEATTLLTAKHPEDTIDIIGPLGNGFPAPSEGSRPVLVAGGIGLGPVLFLAKAMRETQTPPLLIFGARNRYQVPLEIIEPLSASIDIAVCTDDGSQGFKGTAADYLQEHCPEHPEFFTCGPHPMMKAVYDLSRTCRARCWVSMEQIMACGVGACMGCAIAVKGEKPFARVCVEGPVFDGDAVVW
ncbi:MAG: dihydroorotate dehydrogenase electron transfer subunit [Spirochaetales bacterium]|nr:dihydroorotate dehydrogenase electron transfer subunit [Spirochaetales bacterium]